MKAPEVNPGLERDIQALKKFARPLKEEVVVTALMDVISRIIDLPDNLSEMTESRIRDTEREVAECKRILEQFSYDAVNRIISHPDPSTVFKILGNANAFASELNSMQGQFLYTPDGRQIIKVTPKLIEALTRYRFSIGTPPITPEGIKTIERLIFGGDLTSIYAFRDLLGGDTVLFDRFLSGVDRLVDQSTHYTTDAEKKSFQREATDFAGLEGLRGFGKIAMSGGSKSVIRIMREQLLSRHNNGSMPLKVVDRRNGFKGDLLSEMMEDRQALFVIRASQVPYDTFTTDKLKPEWHGIVGRLVIIDDSDNAHKSGTTLVYSLHPELLDALDKFTVKDSGTVANTQLNLRLLIEKFKISELDDLIMRSNQKLAHLEKEGVHNASTEDVRRKEWVLTGRKDYISLKKFIRFLNFVKRIKGGDEAALVELNNELEGEVTAKTREYFLKNLGPKYSCISVPQGGGRRELGLIGRFYYDRSQENLAAFRGDKLEKAKSKLAELKREMGIREGGTAAEKTALDRSVQQTASPNAPIQALAKAGGPPSAVHAMVRTALQEAMHSGTAALGGKLSALRAGVDTATAANLTGKMHARVSQALSVNSLGSYPKAFERGGFRTAGNLVRGAMGTARRVASGALEIAEGAVTQRRHEMEAKDLNLIERMLIEIESGTFKPNLAMPEMRWSFPDVLDDVRFPAKNYLNISINSKGELDPDSLEKRLEAMKVTLTEFPDLFKLYCENTLLVINDPHNPTSRVAKNSTKLKLLDIASKYGLTILADEAYHKQIEKPIKDDQGDFTLAEFYENNRTRFPNPITIFSSLPSTKWAMGAGRRSGVVVSNDVNKVNGLNFEEYVRQNVDGVNSMSLFFDRESLNSGVMVKKVCKALEPAIVRGNTAAVIDDLISEYFADPAADDFCASVYFELIQARNDLDRLSIRGASPLDVRRFTSDLISKLKNFRLEKQTQRDSAQRTKAVISAVKELSEEYPGLEDRFIQPEGPFYFCVKLDDGPSDPDLLVFLESIARARKIDAVPVQNGYVRFAFGGQVDNTKEGYQLLQLAIKTDLKILLTYWQKFKMERARLSSADNISEAKSLNPVHDALKSIFPGGESDMVATIQEKGELIKAIGGYKSKGRGRLTYPFPPSVAPYLSSIEPESPATIVTINDASCRTVEEFIRSRAFKDLFNHYLIQVSGSIVALQGMEKNEIISQYGAHQFIEKFDTRDSTNIKKGVFQEIVIKVAKLWFSDSTIKILGLKADQKHDSISGDSHLRGATARIQEHIQSFIRAFTTAEQEAEIGCGPTFQAGYEIVEGVKAARTLPKWAQSIIGKTQFAGQTVPTDPAPEIITPGATRVSSYDKGIFNRTGNGEDLPTSKYFSSRLEEFAEQMDPKDYVCKMVQVGPTRLMLVMHRSYTHYMAEELRLMPQFDVSIDDLENLKPDAVSFLGIPTKVMGDDYKIGEFFDECTDGTRIPVSWVDRENITDYMGYLKKPLLTIANERVKDLGGEPVHGSAFIVTANNGLRKGIGMKGDSGTGKSETIVAMLEQVIEGFGGAANIKSVDLLAGDMLSFWEGENEEGQKDVYLLGTESGDFMRMTDISTNYRETFRDLIENASKTNVNHPTNPRMTLGGLCDEQVFLKPVRVNIVLNINNFEEPPGSAFQEVENPEIFMTDIYPRGYRREKGTSGDQPNIFASVKYGKSAGSDAILSKYGESLDTLLGWDVILDESGKTKNATLKFNDLPGEVFTAKRMVKDLFKGKIISETPIQEGEKQKDRDAAFRISKDANVTWEVEDVEYSCRENCYYLELKDANSKAKSKYKLNRNVFDRVYSPIASTYCGNPFIDPRGMGEVLQRFAGVMKKAGVITGQIYTQLAVKGREFSGPAQAAQSTLNFIQNDPRINERFTGHCRKVSAALMKKYGNIINQENLPRDLEAHNLLLLERQESDNIHLIDKNGKTIPLKTPYFTNRKSTEKREFNASLITPDIQEAIVDICSNPDHLINLERVQPDMELYKDIVAWDSDEELIYQALLCQGMVKLGNPAKDIYLWPKEVKKAQKAAEMIKAKASAGGRASRTTSAA